MLLDDGCRVGSELLTENSSQRVGAIALGCLGVFRSLTEDGFTAAASEGALSLPVAERFLGRDGYQELPEVDSVAEPVEPAQGYPGAEAVYRAQGDVFGILDGVIWGG